MALDKGSGMVERENDKERKTGEKIDTEKESFFLFFPFLSRAYSPFALVRVPTHVVYRSYSPLIEWV